MKELIHMNMTAGEIKNWLLVALSAAGSLAAQCLGGWDGALAMLVGVMAADYATGLLAALVFKKSKKTAGGGASSRVGFLGLLKKCLILVLVWFGTLLDGAAGTSCVRTAVVLFFTANEGISVLENTALMGVPYPAFLKAALEALRRDGGTETK